MPSRQATLDMSREADYIREHYGRCETLRAGRGCRCMKQHFPTWMQAMCENWTPVRARNWKELKDELYQDGQYQDDA